MEIKDIYKKIENITFNIVWVIIIIIPPLNIMAFSLIVFDINEFKYGNKKDNKILLLGLIALGIFILELITYLIIK